MKPETTIYNRPSIQKASHHRLETYQQKLLALSSAKNKSKNSSTSKGDR
ncbi:MAG: hypothetical protein SPF19_16165 [Oliverpabstia sp.]|nr:hypothetical protein [Oliverpabstia sp.]